MALYAYRRQEFLRDICALVGYNRRNLWVVQAEDVTTLAAKCTGPSRIGYSIIALSPLEVLGLEGRDEVTVLLGSTIAVVAQPRLRGRRGTMLLFVHPTVYDKYTWSSRKTPPLKLEELNALRGSKGSDPATEQVGRAICYHRGLLDWKGERTDRGTALLIAHVGRKVLGPLTKQG